MKSHSKIKERPSVGLHGVVRRRLGGYVWESIHEPGMKVAWREEHGRYHICRTFGLMPWELYEGDFHDKQAHMRTLKDDSDRMRSLVEGAVKYGRIKPPPND